MLLTIDFDEFLSWLASHQDEEVVGLPGRCFHSPLACFLSQQTGRVIGVDGKRYGWALADERRWVELPRWAQVFTVVSEAWFGRALTALQAVDLLIQVETTLVSTPVLAVV